MDYKSYKAMCDGTLQQIRRSENKREELSDKLQKMYQEKSECEKSIIKTLQTQQKQFAEEKRRREERNESILRTLERIDYQAHLLATKTERLRALKKQYERYLLGLYATRRMTVYPIGNQLTGTFVKPFMGKHDESPIHQSSYYNHSTFAPPPLDLTYLSQAYPPSFESTYVTATTHTPPYHHYNQSHYSRVLLTPTAVSENSIKAGNYLSTTGAPANDRDSQFPYPFPSASTTMPFEKKSDNVPVNIGDMNLAPTINSIYSPRRQCNDLPLAQQQIPSSSGFQSIYQQNSQPLQNQHYQNSSVKMSKSPYNMNDNVNPLIMPAAAVVASQILTSPQQQQQPLSSSTPSFENRLKNELKFDSVHITDVPDSAEEIENDAEKCYAARRNSLLLEIPPTSITDSALLRRISIEKIDMMATFSNIETKAINDDGNMHQVWEKVVEESPSELESSHTSFIIPKIIVETQLDVAETTAVAVNSPEEIITKRVDSDATEKPLSGGGVDEHSGDNGSLAATSNNSPIMEVESSIYHYGKQLDDEQQHSSVEGELQKFNDMKISVDDSAGVTMTSETEIKSNNSADKINDDGKNQPAIALNDKISEIYRKIEKIEGEYYGEKEKLIENFEKRMSSPTPTHDEAVLQFEPEESLKFEELSQEHLNKSEFKLQEESPDGLEIESTQSNYELHPNEMDQQSSQQEEIHPPGDYQQPMFEDNQYASPVSKSNDEVVDGGELQATFVEYPSSTEMQYQQPSSQEYFATGFEQVEPNSEYDYTQYEQSNSNYEQNNNYETTENLSNYNESAAEVYYDQNQTEIYDDQNYSNQQQQNEIEPTSEYFFQQQAYDNNVTDAPAYLQDGNYYGNSEEFIETSNVAYTTEDGTYGNVDMYRESQVPLESVNYEDTQESQQHVERQIEVDDNESLNATTLSSDSSKPSVDMEMSAVAVSSTKREDVKLVKQLLDSESDDTSRSNLLNTAIKEEEKEDESDFDFSTN